jgi:hypothetical protein
MAFFDRVSKAKYTKVKEVHREEQQNMTQEGPESCDQP